MTDVKIQLKLASLEVAYEGPGEFAETSLIDIIQQISEVDLPNIVESDASSGIVQQPLGLPSGATTGPKLSTSDFAVKMGAKSGTDLVMAAAASLHHSRGLEEFKRTDIHAEMKTAKAFYRSSYGGNLSKSLETLVKSGRLQTPRPHTYALAYTEIESLGTLLQ